MQSRSDSNLNLRSETNRKTASMRPRSSTKSANRHLTANNDSGKIQDQVLEKDPLLNSARKQESLPNLKAAVGQPSQERISSLESSNKSKSVGSSSSSSSLQEVFGVKSCSTSSETISPETPSESICTAFRDDPKLKTLCSSVGLSHNPNTLVGPIEKGQLIVATLQDGLHDLIKLKMRIAEKKGKKFHIQQSGLDEAVRALENAERSLKTIKEAKEPVLGKARRQLSSETVTLPQKMHKTTEAVIRILTTAKEKFDKMENGWKFIVREISLSSTPLPPPPIASRRGTGLSTLSALMSTAPCSRAKTSGSSTSVGSAGSRRGKLVST